MTRDGRLNPYIDAAFYMNEECGLLTIAEVHFNFLTFSLLVVELTSVLSLVV